MKMMMDKVRVSMLWRMVETFPPVASKSQAQQFLSKSVGVTDLRIMILLSQIKSVVRSNVRSVGIDSSESNKSNSKQRHQILPLQHSKQSTLLMH